MIRCFSKAVLAGVMLACVCSVASAKEKMPVIRPIDSEAAANYHGPNLAVYTLHGGDQLQVTVFGEQDFSGVACVVRIDGYLTLPLIGDVMANGKTLQQLTEEITERLREYIIDPRVSINITGMGTTQVYVLGEVGHQGVFNLTKSHRLIDALAMAGGFNDFSSKKSIFVIRNGSQEASLKVNFQDLLATGSPEANIELYEGDCVYLAGTGSRYSFSKFVAPWLSAFTSIVNTGKSFRDW